MKKKFELLQKLVKCDTEAHSEQMLLEKMVPMDLLDRVPTNLLSVKSTVSAAVLCPHHQNPEQLYLACSPFTLIGFCLQVAAYLRFTSSPLSMSCLLLWSRSLNIPTGRALVSSVLQVVALRQQIILLILESQFCWI